MNSSNESQPISPSRARWWPFESTLATVRKVSTALLRSPLGRVVSRRERRLRLRETLPLGERRMIVLVEFDNQTLLVGVTGNSMTLLTPSARERTALEESPELRGAHRIACGEEQ
jgi:hypothetical protein